MESNCISTVPMSAPYAMLSALVFSKLPPMDSRSAREKKNNGKWKEQRSRKTNPGAEHGIT